MQKLLIHLTQTAQKVFNSKSLKPTYAFFSEYRNPDSFLPKHRDNNGNTYTIDLCLYSKRPWGLFVEGEKYNLLENEALCFYGEEQEHWRDSLGEDNCVGVVFFHFAEPDHDFFAFQSNLQAYESEGYVLINEFSNDLIPDYQLFVDEKSEIIFEKDNENVRSIYAFHNNSNFLNWLSKQQIIRKFVTSIIGKDVYLHQSKINFKNNSADSVWPFHRDFPFWNIFDHIDVNRMINVVIYLDDVNESSGAINFIPKSHKLFLERELQNSKMIYSLEGSSSNDLLFAFSEEEILLFTSKYGIISAQSKKGSILFFDPNIIHGSGTSKINSDRKLMILTFNSCENLPKKPTLRPEYLASSTFEPIKWFYQ
jgi:ectoine hydroxylase